MAKLTKKHLILMGIMLAATVGLTLVHVPANITSDMMQGNNAGVYATIGDAAVYAAVMLCGWPWGGVVAAVGSAVADAIVGSNYYIIGTLLVKFGMAYVAALLAMRCKSFKQCFLSAGVVEMFMIVGYFIFNLLIIRDFLVAGKAFLVDLAQGVVCVGLGGLVLHYLPVVRPSTMPRLKTKRRPVRERDDEWN